MFASRFSLRVVTDWWHRIWTTSSKGVVTVTFRPGWLSIPVASLLRGKRTRRRLPVSSDSWRRRITLPRARKLLLCRQRLPGCVQSLSLGLPPILMISSISAQDSDRGLGRSSKEYSDRSRREGSRPARPEEAHSRRPCCKWNLGYLEGIVTFLLEERVGRHEVSVLSP